MKKELEIKLNSTTIRKATAIKEQSKPKQTNKDKNNKTLQLLNIINQYASKQGKINHICKKIIIY